MNKHMKYVVLTSLVTPLTTNFSIVEASAAGDTIEGQIQQEIKNYNKLAKDAITTILANINNAQTTSTTKVITDPDLTPTEYLHLVLHSNDLEALSLQRLESFIKATNELKEKKPDSASNWITLVTKMLTPGKNSYAKGQALNELHFITALLNGANLNSKIITPAEKYAKKDKDQYEQLVKLASAIEENRTEEVPLTNITSTDSEISKARSKVIKEFAKTELYDPQFDKYIVAILHKDDNKRQSELKNGTYKIKYKNHTITNDDLKIIKTKFTTVTTKLYDYLDYWDINTKIQEIINDTQGKQLTGINKIIKSDITTAKDEALKAHSTAQQLTQEELTKLKKETGYAPEIPLDSIGKEELQSIQLTAYKSKKELMTAISKILHPDIDENKLWFYSLSDTQINEVTEAIKQEQLQKIIELMTSVNKKEHKFKTDLTNLTGTNLIEAIQDEILQDTYGLNLTQYKAISEMYKAETDHLKQLTEENTKKIDKLTKENDQKTKEIEELQQLQTQLTEYQQALETANTRESKIAASLNDLAQATIETYATSEKHAKSLIKMLKGTNGKPDNTINFIKMQLLDNNTLNSAGWIKLSDEIDDTNYTYAEVVKLIQNGTLRLPKKTTTITTDDYEISETLQNELDETTHENKKQESARIRSATPKKPITIKSKKTAPESNIDIKNLKLISTKTYNTLEPDKKKEVVIITEKDLKNLSPDEIENLKNKQILINKKKKKAKKTDGNDINQVQPPKTEILKQDIIEVQTLNIGDNNNEPSSDNDQTEKEEENPQQSDQEKGNKKLIINKKNDNNESAYNSDDDEEFQEQDDEAEEDQDTNLKDKKKGKTKGNTKHNNNDALINKAIQFSKEKAQIKGDAKAQKEYIMKTSQDDFSSLTDDDWDRIYTKLAEEQ